MRLLTDMEAFVELAKLRNFGRAATALGVTASTLSRRISGLEKELGVVLVRRSTRSFSLTESGELFLARSKAIVAEALRTKEEAGANFNRVAGPLRVGAPSDLASTILTPVFSKYCLANPAVSMEIVSTQGQPDLNRDALNLAFVVAHQVRVPDASYSMHKIGSFSRMMYASRGYVKRNGFPSDPGDLANHRCIRHLDGRIQKEWELHQGRKGASILVSGNFACSSVLVSSQAARGHLGIVMLPQHLATHPAFGAGLVRVLPEWEGTKAFVFAVTQDRTSPARMVELIRLARAEFKKQLVRLESIGTC